MQVVNFLFVNIQKVINQLMEDHVQTVVSACDVRFLCNAVQYASNTIINSNTQTSLAPLYTGYRQQSV